MKSGIWIKLQSDNKNDKNPAGNGVTVVPQDFILQGDKTPTSVGGELQQFSLGGSPISFQDKILRIAEVRRCIMSCKARRASRSRYAKAYLKLTPAEKYMIENDKK